MSPLKSPLSGKSAGEKRVYYLTTPYMDHFVAFLGTFNMLNDTDAFFADAAKGTLQHLFQNWTSPSRLGPVRKYLLSKDSFEPLPDLDPTSVVTFYDDLESRIKHYLVLLTPFDNVNVDFGVYSICLPGIGVERYQMMAKALFDVLQNLLPKTADVQNQVNIFKNTGADGYALLFAILQLSIPGFNNPRTASEPRWDSTPDISEFAKAYTMYLRLERVKGRTYTDKDKSLKFLNGIRSFSYFGVITSLKMQVQQAQSVDGNEYFGTLPPLLHISALAVEIKEQMKGMMEDNSLLALDRRINQLERGHPRAHRLIGGTTPIDTDYSSDDDSIHSALDDLPGMNPIVRAARDNRPRPPPRDGCTPRDRTRSPAPFRRPRTTFDASLQCGACKSVGHLDANCYHLARAIFLERFMRNPNNATICKRMEKEWLSRQAERQETSRINSRRVLKTYLDRHNYSLDQMEYLMGPDLMSLWSDDPSPEDSL